MSDYFDLELISDETKSSGYDYDERIRRYKCPCGKGDVVWSKEKPNGNGSGYHATFSDVFWYCDICEPKYDFWVGQVKLKK